MAKHEFIPSIYKPEGFRINLKDWCSRPTYRQKYIYPRDLLYVSNGSRNLSQRAAYSMIEDFTTKKNSRVVELHVAGRHANTFKVGSNMDALLKICDLAIKYGATRNRRDGEKPNDQYEVVVR